MKYILQNYSDEYIIINDDADYQAGFVRPLKLGLHGARFSVRNENCDEIAVVKSLDEAIPALAAYYNENPPRWERESATRYNKWTQFGQLLVKQYKAGQWSAYRQTESYDYPLLCDGKPAIFATSEEAKRTADAHLRDGYPNSKTINDDFSWLPDPDIDWRACPYRTATRARLAA